MIDPVFNVLFLCTGNSARSIMPESILRSLQTGGFSAGSHPKGAINPFPLKTIEACGCATEGLRSKSWNEFATPDAPKLDFAFTLCDDAAGETCPAWPGQPMTAHWGIEDPATVEGADTRVRASLPLLAEQDHGVHCSANQESRQFVAHRVPARNRQDGRRYTFPDESEGHAP